MAPTEADPGLPTITRIERGSVAAWPALETVRDGGWLWRFANGHTKRANCIQSMAATDDGHAGERIARLAARSRERGIPPVFRVTALAGPGIVSALDALGWQPFDYSLVLTRQLAGIEVPDVRHRIDMLPSNDWLEAQRALQHYGAETMETLGALTMKMPKEAIGVTVFSAEGSPAASLAVVTADGIAHVLNVITDPEYRRRGLARAALALGLQRAKDLGAEAAALAVLADNGPAVGLYRGAGFRQVGRYHYCRGES